MPQAPRIAALAAVAFLALTCCATASAATTKVMTRNLYLGADVGVALNLLPNMPAAAQFMWDQVEATDFDQRAPQFAAEAARERPDVIALQEATTWNCSTGLGGNQRVVFDFARQFLAATEAAGTPYVLAAADGTTARNPGFSLGPIPFLTKIHDPETFQPLFGTDDANCGFQMTDALAVRADLASSVLAAGTADYPTDTTIAPLVLVVPRGLAWADIDIRGTPTRFVTTHLESLWTAGAVPASAKQATELVRTLASTTMPLVAMGDFNSDPRDPRDPERNPGGQPEVSNACPMQTAGGDAHCSAYWTMRGAGFIDAGPDATDPRNFTWGASALLAGPDLARVEAARRAGNPYGFTDRLDFVFLRNGARALDAHLIGNTWPDGDDLWACSTPAQATSAAQAATALGVADPATTRCLPTDHAGVVATIALPASTAINPPLPARVSERPLTTTIALIAIVAVAVGVVAHLALALVLIVPLMIVVARQRRRRRS
jgi:endonuclease/exonuclease/phosphatase family metal-dependent hydrolase